MCGLSRCAHALRGLVDAADVDKEPRSLSFYSLPGERLLNSGLLVLRRAHLRLLRAGLIDAADETTAQMLLDHIEHDPIVPTLKTVEQDLLAHVFAHRWIPLHWKVRDDALLLC